MGRSYRADLQVPGGGEPPPYGCMAGAWWVWMELPGRFAGARRGRAPALRVHGRSRVRWAGCIAGTRIVGRGSCPRRPLTGTPHPIQTHRTPKPVIANQRARWCGNPFPLQAARLARPGRGAILARVHDRPHGRCNAFALRGNGLPRRCAPHNDRFGGLVRWGEGARQICRCPAGTSPRPTGA